MKSIARIRALAVLGALALSAGCADLTVDSGAGEVTGLTIEDGGGAVVTVNASGGVNGTLAIARNATRSLRVVLRGPGGTVTPGIAESVRVTVTNPGVATWTETGQSTGTLRGVAAGTTSLRVDLLSAGAAVYTSPSITVQVTN